MLKQPFEQVVHTSTHLVPLHIYENTGGTSYEPSVVVTHLQSVGCWLKVTHTTLPARYVP